MRRLVRYILLIMVLGIGRANAQQTIHFSQYLFNGLTVNPAYAGYKENWTLNASGRLQWEGVDGAPKTSTLSIDGVTNGETKNIGLGLLVINDRLGPENNSAVYANYAYRLRMDEDDSQRLSFGIGVGAVQYSIDGAAFATGGVTDPSAPVGVNTRITPDFRAGIFYYAPWYYIGVSALNLLPDIDPDPNKIFVNRVRTYYLTSGFLIPVSPVVNFKPSVLFKEDFKGPTNLSVASHFLFGNVLWVGASYSFGVRLWEKDNLQTDLNPNDALSGAVAVNITPNFRVGYSYDFGTGSLSGYQSSSHEVSLSFSFVRKKGRIVSPRYF